MKLLNTQIITVANTNQLLSVKHILTECTVYYKAKHQHCS